MASDVGCLGQAQVQLQACFSQTSNNPTDNRAVPARPPWDKSWQEWFGAKGDPNRKHMFWSLIPIGVLWAQMIFAGWTHMLRAHQIFSSDNDAFTAFDLTVVANDFCMIILNLLVIALWTTLCSQTKNMRHLWCWKSWVFGDDTMTGLGFVPRPAAASVGFLLFVTGVFVSERVVEAGDLTKNNGIADGEWCRADVKEQNIFKADGNWDSRLHRQLPIGCYFGIRSSDTNSTTFEDQAIVPHMFNVVTNGTGAYPRNLDHPYKFDTNVPPIFFWLWSLLPRWMRGTPVFTLGADGEYELDTEYICMYQCVKWKIGWGFQEVMAKLGVVVAGGTVVTKLTGSVTEVCGFSRVTEDTNAEELDRILSYMEPPKPNSFIRHYVYKSSCFCALVLCLIKFLAMNVYKIDDHGLYTVDYYVSMTIVFSVITSAMLRSFNPYTMSFVAYTKDLWKNGVDSFIIYNEEDHRVEVQSRLRLLSLRAARQSRSETPEDNAMREDAEVPHHPTKPRDIDLFVWLHLSHIERAYLLINHARKVSTNSNNAVGKQVECIMFGTYEQLLPKRVNGQEVMVSFEFKVCHGNKGEVLSIQGDTAVVLWNTAALAGGAAPAGGALSRGGAAPSGGAAPMGGGRQQSAGRWYDGILRQGEEPPEDPDGRWERRARTAPIDISHIADYSTKWDVLLAKYVGDEKKVAVARQSIAAQIKQNTKVIGEPSLWVLFRLKFWLLWHQLLRSLRRAHARELSLPVASDSSYGRLVEAQPRRVPQNGDDEERGTRRA